MNFKINHINRNTIVMIAAFAAVYLIWGSTYLGIKYAIETLPSFMMAGTRFLVAGSVLFLASRFSRDYEKSTRAYWKTSFIIGALLLLGGNGAVVIAEHYLSSSLAALLIATEPFWIVLIGWLAMGGIRPNFKVVTGLVIGFIGVALLVGGQGIDFGSGTGQLFGIVLVILSTLSWAAGSLYGTRGKSPKSSMQAAGMQMLAGGSLLMLASFLTGEWFTFDIRSVSAHSWLALGYLTLFGSIIAFTAYSWLFKNVEPALASTYAYVNPVIAVILGWLIAGESLTSETMVGAGVIVGSVALITSQGREESSLERDIEIHESQIPPDACKVAAASA